MTRSEMLAAVRDNLMQGLGPLTDFSGPSEERALDTAADETAQRTDCYYKSVSNGLVQGQTRYCLPKIYKVKRFYMVDASGKVLSVSVRTPVDADRDFCGWRTWAAADPPRLLIRAGLNDFTVAPAPLVTRAAALVVAGFALPSLPKSGHASHQWDTDDDECPLAPWAHEAVVLRTTEKRLRQLAVREPAALGLAADYERRWKSELGELSMQAANAYRDICEQERTGLYGVYPG